MEIKVPNDLQDLFQLSIRSEATVLITGPTGSGKTELARMIHLKSPREKKPFITINLASLHEGTFESELFGHEKGSFTGASHNRKGRLELSDGGTILLDEIGELSLRMQARLLEFLQSRIIVPIGGNRPIPLDVRVIAATNRDLRRAVRSGDFREDLFHRLRVVPIPLKSLCERYDEFDEIIHGLLRDLSLKYGKVFHEISEEVVQIFEKYHWPGNFRELRSVIEYAVLSSKGPCICTEHLPVWFREGLENGDEKKNGQEDVELPAHLGVAEVPLSFDFHQSLVFFEREYLRRALRRFNGRVNRTARQIGMSKATLIRRIRAYRLHSDFEKKEKLYGVNEMEVK